LDAGPYQSALDVSREAKFAALEQVLDGQLMANAESLALYSPLHTGARTRLVALETLDTVSTRAIDYGRQPTGSTHPDHHQDVGVTR
jgi:hypothetical protein